MFPARKNTQESFLKQAKEQQGDKFPESHSWDLGNRQKRHCSGSFLLEAK
jgi:hypothetical protein